MTQYIGSIDTPYEVDWYPVELIGGIDYVATALGASNAGGTLQDPLVALVDSYGNVLTYSDDSFALGEDPLLQFNAPSSGTYYLAVVDFATGSTGSYTFVFDQAGPPVYFSPPGTAFS